jgi:hypothetical protein
MRRKIRADRIRMKQEQEMMQRKFWDDMFLYGGVQPSWWLDAWCCTWQLTLSSGTQNDSISRNTFNW